MAAMLLNTDLFIVSGNEFISLLVRENALLQKSLAFTSTRDNFPQFLIFLTFLENK